MQLLELLGLFVRRRQTHSHKLRTWLEYKVISFFLFTLALAHGAKENISFACKQYGSAFSLMRVVDNLFLLPCVCVAFESGQCQPTRACVYVSIALFYLFWFTHAHNHDYPDLLIGMMAGACFSYYPISKKSRNHPRNHLIGNLLCPLLGYIAI